MAGEALTFLLFALRWRRFDFSANGSSVCSRAFLALYPAAASSTFTSPALSLLVRRRLGFFDSFLAGTDAFGRNVSAGMYFYLLQAGDFRQVNKMILLK